MQERLYRWWRCPAVLYLLPSSGKHCPILRHNAHYRQVFCCSPASQHSQAPHRATSLWVRREGLGAVPPTTAWLQVLSPCDFSVRSPRPTRSCDHRRNHRHHRSAVLETWSRQPQPHHDVRGAGQDPLLGGVAGGEHR